MSTRLTELLHCELPIQLAPMGSVSATPRLPLAVAQTGAHAMYPGLGTPPHALAPVLDELVESGKPFGVNFLVPRMDRGSLELAAERAPYVDFFLAEPDAALVDVVHQGGGVCGWQVESGDEARAAEAAGCEVLIAKGAESGGRKRIEAAALTPLLEEVRNAVSVPVIAAGGIGTAADVRASLAAGADGVRVGTRFIAAAESDAHPVWVRAAIAADAGDSVVSMAFNVGMPEPGPHRVLRSSIDAAEKLDSEEAGVVVLPGIEMPVPPFAPNPPTRWSTGAIEAMPLYAGSAVGAVTAVQPAAEIVAELAAGV
jgi:NAD(P)H-dependent flavin oxidoreductase YrpB (nitropropane dioxygenase family)